MGNNKSRGLFIITGIIILILGVAVFLKFFVFSNNNDKNILDAKALNIGYTQLIESNTYKIINTFGKELNLNKAQGIAYYNNRIIVSDTENDRLVILGNDGRLLKVVGRSGNAQGEFIKPRGITVDKEGNILVVDSGNNRLEIFDSEGNYKDQLPINEFNTPFKASEYIRDVEIDDFGNIYISTYAYYGERQGIYVYNNKKLITHIKCNASGLLSKCNNEIFFIVDVELAKSSNERRLKAGKTYICKVTPDKLESIYKLNNSSSPKSICFYKNNYYILSKSMPSIDMFDSNYKYKETVFTIKWRNRDDYRAFTDMTVDNDGNFYCIDDEKNLINVLQKKG